LERGRGGEREREREREREHVTNWRVVDRWRRDGTSEVEILEKRQPN